MISRRKFLKKAGSLTAFGIAAGLPTIIPASALGKGSRPAPSNRTVMALIGAGQQGVIDMKSFLTREEVQWVAVCDVDADYLQAAKAIVDQKYGTSDCRMYGDFRELLERESLDAVLLALPDHWHSIPAIMAARKGIDIYGEKPFSHSLAEGRAMCEAVRRYGRIWQTGSWQRSVASFRRACELVRNGRIGKVTRVEVGLGEGRKIHHNKVDDPTPEPIPSGFNYDMWLGPAPLTPYTSNKTHKNWRWNLDYGGGYIMDWIGHHGDIAHWGLGYDNTGPVHVEASGDQPTGLWNAPTKYNVTCRYADGVVINIKSSFRIGVKFIGSNGSVFVSRETLEAEPQSVLNEVIGPEEIQLYRSTDHTQNFLDCVRSGEQTITPAETAHRSASVGHLALIAIKLNRRLIWNPATETFPGDDEANRLLACPMREPWHV